MMSENKRVRFIITRQDSPETAPYQEEFELEYRPNMNVISALNGNSSKSGECKRGKNNSDQLGYELSGRSLRSLFNGNQRKATPILYSTS